ncbi:MAG: hypothetical protein QW046_03360 [Candidatus Micrarchaeaceae archaeon]
MSDQNENTVSENSEKLNNNSEFYDNQVNAGNETNNNKGQDITDELLRQLGADTTDELQTPTIESTPDGVICPACRKTVPFFITNKPKGRMAKCPSCGAQFARRLIPDDKIVVDESLFRMAGFTSLDSIKSKVKERYAQIAERLEVKDKVETPKEQDKGKEQTSIRVNTQDLIDVPKDPCDVLAETLSEFSNLNIEFVKVITNRCRRMSSESGGMHPYELLYYLKNMKSGIKTSAEADFIVSEYVAALQKESEKANRKGLDYPYWLLNYQQPNAQMSMPPFPMPRYQADDRTPPPPMPSGVMYQRRVEREPEPRSQPSTDLSLVKEMMQMQKENTQLMVENIQKQNEMNIKTLQDGLNQGLGMLAQAINQLAQMLQQPKNDGLSMDKLEKLLMEKDKQMEEKLRQLQDELREKKTEEKMEQIKKEYEAKLAQQANEMNQIKQYLQAVQSNYTSDQAKLIGSTVQLGAQTVKEVASDIIGLFKERRPVQDLVVNLAPQIRKVTTNQNISEMLKTQGLIDEDDNSQ